MDNYRGTRDHGLHPIDRRCARRARRCAGSATKGRHDEELAIQPDHIHLFVRVWPSNSAAEVLKEVKGVTSHELRNKYPQLCKLPSLWTRSYFAATAGNVSEETIRRYIEAQKGV